MKALSVLICSIKGREEKLHRLLNGLLNVPYVHLLDMQDTHKIDYYHMADSEVIVYTDDRQITTGEKTNRLIALATGNYVTRVDDDDWVASDYKEQIIAKTATNPDCIVFDAYRFDNGKEDRLVKYGIEYGSDRNTPECYYRIPNHLMAFKRGLALLVPYENISWGEDARFAKAILPLIKTQERIDKVLYHYLFTDQSTSNQKQRR